MPLFQLLLSHLGQAHPRYHLASLWLTQISFQQPSFQPLPYLETPVCEFSPRERISQISSPSCCVICSCKCGALSQEHIEVKSVVKELWDGLPAWSVSGAKFTSMPKALWEKRLCMWRIKNFFPQVFWLIEVSD